MTNDTSPTIDERFQAVLAHRGSLRIAELIVLASGAPQPFYILDEDLVALCERFVERASYPSWKIQ